MTIRYPVVLETEANGVVSAYMPEAARICRGQYGEAANAPFWDVLTAYLEAHLSESA